MTRLKLFLREGLGILGSGQQFLLFNNFFPLSFFDG
jgi:hypothetical protein